MNFIFQKSKKNSVTYLVFGLSNGMDVRFDYGAQVFNPCKVFLSKSILKCLHTFDLLSLRAAAFSTEQTNFKFKFTFTKHFDPHHSYNDHSIAGLDSHWVLTDSCGVEDVEATEAAAKAEAVAKAEGFVLRLVCSLVSSSECFSSSSRSSWYAKGAITLLLELLHNNAFWYNLSGNNTPISKIHQISRSHISTYLCNIFWTPKFNFFGVPDLIQI